MTRILVVNVNWVGDVLFSTPALRALRKRFPDAHISCLLPPRCAPVLKNNPHVNELILAADKPFAGFLGSLPLISRLRRGRFDKVIFFHRSKTKAVIARLAGIPEREGYSFPGRDRFLTRAFPAPVDAHRIDYFLKLVEMAGAPSDGRVPDFFPRKEASSELENLLRACGVNAREPYVVIHPGGNWELKRWPAAHFTSWIRTFLKRYPWKVVICGTPPEKEIALAITKEFDSRQVVSLCGQTSMDTLALLLKGARLLVSNDSGPIHLAASQGTKILGVFGPTSAAQTGPVSASQIRIVQKDVGCEVPCYFKSCDARVCMDWLAPEEVFEAAAEMLG